MHFFAPSTDSRRKYLSNTLAEPHIERHCRTITWCCCELSKWLSSAIITSGKKQMTTRSRYAKRRDRAKALGITYLRLLATVWVSYIDIFACTHPAIVSLSLFLSSSFFRLRHILAHYGPYRKHRDTLRVSWNSVYRSDNVRDPRENKNKPVNNATIVQSFSSSFSALYIYNTCNMYIITSRSICVDY